MHYVVITRGETVRRRNEAVWQQTTRDASGGEDKEVSLSMQSFPFIFSEERKWKWRRHLAFWFCWWVFQSVIYAFSAFAQQIPYHLRLPSSALEALLYLFPHVFFSYALMYGIIPRTWLRGKYALGVASVAGIVLVTAAFAAVIGVFLIPLTRPYFLPASFIPPPHYNELNFFISLTAGLRGAITIGGMAAAIKLTKYWYVKEQRNLQLQKENVEAQLQLLKAQVHPHFLFNTLNNIYAQTQTRAPEAAGMVMGLSNLLRFMLYEGSQQVVPLGQELDMLRQYIDLEKVRYNEGLDITLDLPAHTEGLLIAPLLLLPLVENSFKHGASQRLEHPWISLSIRMEGRRMKMKLVNGKADEPLHPGEGGIGLANVRKRLELIYPGRHNLRITEDPDVFIVNLTMDLDGTPAPLPIRETILHE